VVDKPKKKEKGWFQTLFYGGGGGRNHRKHSTTHERTRKLTITSRKRLYIMKAQRHPRPKWSFGTTHDGPEGEKEAARGGREIKKKLQRLKRGSRGRGSLMWTLSISLLLQKRMTIKGE